MPPLALHNIWADIIPNVHDTEIPDSMQLVRAAREGLPGATLWKVAEAYQIPKGDIYDILNISPKTGQRVVSKKLNKDLSGHLIQMVKVFYRTYEVFNNIDKGVKWLKSPCLALGGQIPTQLLDTPEGVELVMNTLGRIEYGVFS